MQANCSSNQERRLSGAGRHNSINNTDPSRQDGQPRGATHRLRKERTEKKKIDLQSQTPITTIESNSRASKTTHTKPTHMHACPYTQQPRTWVIRCSILHFQSFVYLASLMTRSQRGPLRAVVFINSGHFLVWPKHRDSVVLHKPAATLITHTYQTFNVTAWKILATTTSYKLSFLSFFHFFFHQADGSVVLETIDP